MKKVVLMATGAILSLVIVGLAALTVANMAVDRANPRSRAHSYYSSLAVEVDRPIDEVYAYVKYQIPAIYTATSSMHEKFEILNADGLVEGAEVECIEGTPEQMVVNHYVVTKASENTLIQLESVPSIAYDRATMRKIGESGAYVYFDFEALDANRTRLSQTIVLDMQNPVIKSIADIAGYLSGSSQVWDDHFNEELEQLAAHIMRS